MTQELVLVSHVLCPYVQRAVIALSEKQVPFKRMDIDLNHKPEWFSINLQRLVCRGYCFPP